MFTRIAAAFLAVLSVLPLWRMLPSRATGLAGAATADAANAHAALLWNGALIALIPAVLAALLFDPARIENALARIAAPLARPRSGRFALALAIAALVLAAVVARVLGGPTLIDSFAQLLQARYFAAGMMAGPLSDAQPFWHIQQTIITPHGWVSQYPPGYSLLLAGGFLLHGVWLVGPVTHAMATYFAARIADELFESRALGRVAALLVALSPFLLAQSGAYMSHGPAAAFSTAALYFTLRGTRGAALAAGACIGALFAIRPLTGIVAGLVAVAFNWRKASNLALAFAAALPFLIGVALWNAHFFGSPATFGYQAALGPNAGLGFGIDPWGNGYGPLEALAYTSAELNALSLFLLEVPLPLVLFIGACFAVSPTRKLANSPTRQLANSPTRQLANSPTLLFWWAAALVMANLFYWHHGLFIGPRMLADHGPVWVLLAVLSVSTLIRSVRAAWLIGGYSVRSFALGGAVAALLGGVLLLAPMRIASYRPSAEMRTLMRAPESTAPALVFVHGGWTSRIAMRLAGHGMRLDSVETALRQNPTCTVQRFANDYAAGIKPIVRLDFEPRSTHLPQSIELTPGNRIRVQNGETISRECRDQARADREGVVDISPIIWQGDLPGMRAHGALFVRDLGPAANARLIQSQPGREVFMLRVAAGESKLVPYQTAIRALWQEAP